jgi:aspartokinase/homoserine dehydrogenase 1
MKVLKFGGSSVGTPERIKGVIKIVSESAEREEYPVVVFSAFQGITDLLIEAGKKASSGKESYKNIFAEIKTRHLSAVNDLTQGGLFSETEKNVNLLLDDLQHVLYGIYLVKEMSPRSLDYVMSFGERLSAFIISQAFNSAGIKSSFLDSRKLVQTDDSFGGARVNFNATNILIKSYFRDVDGVVVATGFIGSTIDNETTTLGRGALIIRPLSLAPRLTRRKLKYGRMLTESLQPTLKKLKALFRLRK